MVERAVLCLKFDLNHLWTMIEILAGKCFTTFRTYSRSFRFGARSIKLCQLASFN